MPTGLIEVTAISAGYRHVIALKKDGTVVAWCDNRYGQSSVRSALSNVLATAAGDYHTMALKQDNTVVAWGANFWGQTTIPSGLSGVKSIIAREDRTFAILGSNLQMPTLQITQSNNEVSIQGENPVGLKTLLEVSSNLFKWYPFESFSFQSSFNLNLPTSEGSRFFRARYEPLTNSVGSARWEMRDSGVPSLLQEVVYGHGKFIIVGEAGTILLSLNGENWLRMNSKVTNSLIGVTSGKELFVAVGVEGTIVTSPDGTNWIKRFSDVSKRWLRSINFDGATFHAVGDNGFYLRSTNGIDWTENSLITQKYLSSIAFGLGRLAVVGQGATIWTSPPGQFVNMSISSSLNGIAFGNNQFVAAGILGTVVTSSDGLLWRASSILNDNIPPVIFDVKFFLNRFYIVGWGLASSTDAIHWEFEALPTTSFLRSISMGNNSIVAVGEKGAIIQYQINQ